MTISDAVTGVPLGPGVTIEVKAGTYREQVTVDNKDGTASQRAVIRAIGAPGTVIIDGSDPFTDLNQWTLLSQGSSVYKAYLPPYPWTPPQSQVFGNGVRYTYKAPGSEASLLPGEYTKDTNGGLDSGWVYVNAGGQNPANVPIYISHNTLLTRARGFLIRGLPTFVWLRTVA